AIIASGQVEPLVLPARSPNLNAYAERWARSVKEECLSKVVLFGEGSLRRALGEYVEHYHAERNHPGKGNILLFPRRANIHHEKPVLGRHVRLEEPTLQKRYKFYPRGAPKCDRTAGGIANRLAICRSRGGCCKKQVPSSRRQPAVRTIRRRR